MERNKILIETLQKKETENQGAKMGTVKHPGKIIVKETGKTRLITADNFEEEPEGVTYADSSNS
jgi:hypothetical protein